MREQKGTFCISLDFEMLYGVSDLDNQDKWKQTVQKGKVAIPKILNLFKEYHVHASWCTVGMLMAEDKQQLLKYIPSIKPVYKDIRRSNYKMELIGKNEQEDPCHYAYSVIEEIQKVDGQELGSHTFSHYYCMDEGQNIESFSADMDAAVGIAKDRDIVLKSIVFPKNQVLKAYLSEVGNRGLIAYRGTENARIYSGAQSGQESFLKRLARLLDNYLNFSGMNCYYVNDLEITEGVVNVQSSRFFRPYIPALCLVEPLRLHRIKKQMEYAAKNGMLFHLWWHPHNFGNNTDENLKNLDEILKWYSSLQSNYGMQTMNMSEVANKRLMLEKDK